MPRFQEYARSHRIPHIRCIDVVENGRGGRGRVSWWVVRRECPCGASSSRIIVTHNAVGRSVGQWGVAARSHDRSLARSMSTSQQAGVGAVRNTPAGGWVVAHGVNSGGKLQRPVWLIALGRRTCLLASALPFVDSEQLGSRADERVDSITLSLLERRRCAAQKHVPVVIT